MYVVAKQFSCLATKPIADIYHRIAITGVNQTANYITADFVCVSTRNTFIVRNEVSIFPTILPCHPVTRC